MNATHCSTSGAPATPQEGLVSRASRTAALALAAMPLTAVLCALVSPDDAAAAPRVLVQAGMTLPGLGDRPLTEIVRPTIADDGRIGFSGVARQMTAPFTSVSGAWLFQEDAFQPIRTSLDTPDPILFPPSRGRPATYTGFDIRMNNKGTTAVVFGTSVGPGIETFSASGELLAESTVSSAGYNSSTLTEVSRFDTLLWTAITPSSYNVLLRSTIEAPGDRQPLFDPRAVDPDAGITIRRDGLLSPSPTFVHLGPETILFQARTLQPDTYHHVVWDHGRNRLLPDVDAAGNRFTFEGQQYGFSDQYGAIQVQRSGLEGFITAITESGP